MKNNTPEAAARAEIKIVRLLIPGPLKSIEISERIGMDKKSVRPIILRLKKADVVQRLPRSTLIGLVELNET